MRKVEPLQWKNDELVLIDQRKLPHEESFLSFNTVEGVHSSIKDMVVRGAPLIGFTALYGMVVAVQTSDGLNMEQLRKDGEFLKTAWAYCC